MTVEAQSEGSTLASVGDGANINAGSLRLDAQAFSAPTAGLTSIGVGLLASATQATITATDTHDVQAYVGAGAHIVTSGDVAILATSTNEATANATLGSGGLGSGIGFTSLASALPQVTASIEDGVTVEAAGNVTLDAESHRATADASTQAVSIGAVSVGKMVSNGQVNPTVYSHIGDNAVVMAGGRVDVLANILAESDPASQPLPDTFQPTTDVNTVDDTIQFATQGLSTGDAVTYSPDGNTPIGTDDSTAVHPPLGTLEDTPERDYRVIVVDADTIKLGALFGAAVADTGDLLNPQSGVDPLRDRIRFDAPHLFQTGDAVKYAPEGSASSIDGLNTSSTYYVQVIDDFTIKLFASKDDAMKPPTLFDVSANPSGVTSDGYIHLNGFTEGEAVTYVAPPPTGFTSVNVNTDGTRETQANIVAGDPALVTVDNNSIYNNSIYVNKHVDANGTTVDGSGYATGDKVTYLTNGTPIGGLTNNTTYYTMPVGSNNVQLVPSYASLSSVTFTQVANGDDTIVRNDGGNWSTDGFAAGQQIVITGTGSNNLTLTIDSVSGNTINIAGDPLTNETHAATLHGSVISLTPDKSTGGQGVEHFLVRQTLGVLQDGVTYYVRDAGIPGEFKLAATPGGTALDVSDIGRSGVHGFGLAGIELTPTTDGGTQELRIDLATQPTGLHQLLGPGGTSLRTASPPAGDGLSVVNTKAVGVGILFNLSLPSATLKITNDAQAWIGGSSLVSADGDIDVATQSVSRGSGSMSDDGGGVVSAIEDQAEVDITNTSKASIGDGATLKSSGQVAVKSDSSMDTHVYANAQGGGFGAGSNAKAFTTIDSNSATGHGTATTVGQGAHIEADTVNLNAQVSHLSTFDQTHALAGGFVAVAIANSSVTTDSTVQNLIEPGALIQAKRGIDIGAFHQNVDVELPADAIPIAFIPIPIRPGSDNTHLTDIVQAMDGARLQTAPRANSDTPLRKMDGSDPLTSLTGYDHLALLVQADDKNLKNVDPASQARSIRWDADVEISAGPSPEVLIDQNGNVVKEIGATVDLSQPGKAIVGDIGGGSGGQVLFISDKITNDTPDAGNDLKALFQFDETYTGITIINKSGLELDINNINVLGSANPFVDLQGSGTVDLTFDLRRGVVPTQITIENLNPVVAADIVLDGTIDNPIGQTYVHAALGDIVAGTNRDELVTGYGNVSRTTLVRTRDLTLDAPQGTIGYDTQNPGSQNHLAVDIVQGPLIAFDSAHHLVTGDQVTYHASPATAPLGPLVDGGQYFVIRLDDQRIELANSLAHAQAGVALAIDPANLQNGTHTITKGATTLTITDGISLVAQAGKDDFIDLKGRLRDPAAQLGNPFVFDIDLIRAGLTGDGSVNVILQAAVLETGSPGNEGGVRVRATNGPQVDQTFYNAFNAFRTEGTSSGAPLDVGFYGTNPVPINATYKFVNRQDGSAGLVANGDATTGNIIVTVKNSAPGNTKVNVSGITEVLNTGHIDVLANGFITLTEQTGDMRVGLIVSTAADVTLTAPGSIVDALNDPDADVIGRNITLRAIAGGIGSANNFVETDLLDTIAGVPQSGALRADAPQSIYIKEVAGDLRVDHVYSTAGDVTLVASVGSILDANNNINPDAADGFYRDADGRIRPATNVAAFNISLDARVTGSIGLDATDLNIDMRDGGRLFAQAARNVFITEVNGQLDVLAARALGGDLRLTVPDTSAVNTENLVLRSGGGTARIDESGDLIVSATEIVAAGSIALWVGDNVTTSATSRIVAGTRITIRGDERRTGNTPDSTDADPGYGTIMNLAGTIGSINAPTTTIRGFTSIYGNNDVDIFNFNQTHLTANTRVYGSQYDTATTADGEDEFYVYQLQSMNVDRAGNGDTLTLDGEGDADQYYIYTSGSQHTANNYVINVLDSGAASDGADQLFIYGADSTLNAPTDPTDDIFLLRAMSYIPNEPQASSAAFVGLLHGSLAAAIAGTGPTAVERVNYDDRLDHLTVEGLAETTRSLSMTTEATRHWTAVQATTRQIGQIFSSLRDGSANIPAPDVFATVATTRGYVSYGASAPLLAEGGSGNDIFTVYSNKAPVQLEGDAGDELLHHPRLCAGADQPGWDDQDGRKRRRARAGQRPIRPERAGFDRRRQRVQQGAGPGHRTGRQFSQHGHRGVRRGRQRHLCQYGGGGGRCPSG